MKTILFLAALSTMAGAAAAQSPNAFSGRGKLGEVWVYPVMFQQSLAPLAPLAREVVKGGQCPDLKVGDDQVVHSYDFDVRMKTRGSGENKRWEVSEMKLVNPSACPALDTRVAEMMRTAIPSFAEPYRDLDKDGWTRIPRVQIKLTD